VTYYRERVAALLRFDALKSAVLSRIDQKMIADCIQFRSNYGARSFSVNGNFLNFSADTTRMRSLPTNVE
jgi:hypothetical protein